MESTPVKGKSPLRQFREELKLTRPQVRELTGIAERTLAYIESGESRPTYEYLAALAKTYGKSLKEMFHAMGIDTSGIPDDSH
ncbi:helix-turn-helix transcriptional regulator [Pannus brasiliensis CCIBt3594]|uniref:Helix-turn-helix transcriptional regulator n=1 Tax=Pannus brasiliensis CCIBt3594 TaxID=1427578 RepID=A0AAW9QFH9_9CHRO